MPEALAASSSPLSLELVSVLLVWTAFAIYVLAFIAYAIDLARRSELSIARQDARTRAVAAERAPVLVGAASAEASVTESVSTQTPAPASESLADVRRSEKQADDDLFARPGERVRPLWARIGTSLMVLGFLFHLGATVTRGIDAQRVPWANMYEFAMTGTLLIAAVYLAVLIRYDLRFLGTFVSGLVAVLLGGSAIFYVDVKPLMDPLKSIWLVVHVFVASLGTAFFALAFALSVVQLLQQRREARAAAGLPKPGMRFLRALPSAETLENLAYRFSIIGFIFWTFTLIAGSVWAQDAWGRFWGFDTKEVWTFVIWVLYAGYIHARATRGWRGTRSAWLSIIGFAAVMFNFTIVNMFFKGLHAYSGLN
ncbi:c-type cytochrome biogenesis protein CcsB [uncultured Microbacterium sp.]|uniref:c-type cytochrome biogenesis protein CcsB n=1 Tax=uncultured Microbacterium sp. TaxID=191216 RepID=UPI0025F2F4D3|nr:c-type cytochrome biogenesis protein CcsB [uncultured Microbacterium sp.]